MGRVELQRSITSVKDLQLLVNKAKNQRADAICVPPFFVDTAAEMLGRNKITIVTTAGQAQDTIDTKLMGIESAAKAGANEVVVSIAGANTLDEKWDYLEKELFRAGQLAGIHNMMLWIGCGFAFLDQVKQARLCEILPRGLVGLRVRGASVSDIQMASIGGVEGFCACFAYGIERGNSPPEQATLDTFTAAGATQFTLVDVPEQKKTDQVYVTEAKL